MIEAIARFIIGLIVDLVFAAFGLLIQHTGNRIMTLFGRNTNSFLDTLVGFLAWAVVVIFTLALIAATRG